MPAKTVFRKQITTFHRTWLEKTICDNDPQFRIPKIQKDLKDVQAMRYYEVEHIRTISDAKYTATLSWDRQWNTVSARTD